MKKSIKWVLGIGILIGIAVGAYFWATAMIESNFNYRSLLKDNPPVSGAPLGDPAADRVVIVLIDALRYDTSLDADLMPTLNQLRTQGAYALMHSQVPSYSEPGYSTILTGAWPEINDGPVFNLDYEEIYPLTQDTLFSAAHRSGLTTAVSGYYWFEKLLPQSEIDYRFYTPGEDAAADREVVDAALPWLIDKEASLVLIHIDQVDYAGHHEGGAQSDNWDAAAKRADDLLAEILTTLDLEKDTIVVLSDHGQIDAGGHGGQDPITLLEPVVMAGKGIKPGQYEDIQMVDVAPTIATLLGTNLPASTQGKVQTEMLALSTSVLNALPEAVQLQQTGLVNAYAKSYGIDPSTLSMPENDQVDQYQAVLSNLISKRTLSQRILRAIPIALFLAVVIDLLLHNRKKGSALWVCEGVLFLALFNLKYAVFDQKTYSFSSVTGVTDLILYISITSIVKTAIVWLLYCLYNKVFHNPPSDAGINILQSGLTMVFILLIPALFSFVLNGAVTTWTLPNYLTTFLALLALIQVLVVSIITPILAGITALVSNFTTRSNPLP